MQFQKCDLFSLENGMRRLAILPSWLIAACCKLVKKLVTTGTAHLSQHDRRDVTLRRALLNGSSSPFAANLRLVRRGGSLRRLPSLAVPSRRAHVSLLRADAPPSPARAPPVPQGGGRHGPPSAEEAPRLQRGCTDGAKPAGAPAGQGALPRGGLRRRSGSAPPGSGPSGGRGGGGRGRG